MIDKTHEPGTLNPLFNRNGISMPPTQQNNADGLKFGSMQCIKSLGLKVNSVDMQSDYQRYDQDQVCEERQNIHR